jgi:hypothetical protein
VGVRKEEAHADDAPFRKTTWTIGVGVVSDARNDS